MSPEPKAVAEVERLHQRLRTVEAERDAALGQLHYVPDDWRYTGRLRAAEARVEALEAALREIAEMTLGEWDAGRSPAEVLAQRRGNRARAALVVSGNQP